MERSMLTTAAAAAVGPSQQGTFNTSNSLSILRSFLFVNEDGGVDASQIHSRPCYLAWLSFKGKTESKANARSFQRMLSNHISGVDGRTPFTNVEEAAILQVIRNKARWPCFGEGITIGCNGFRAKGFHERTTAMTMNNSNFKHPIAGISQGGDGDFVLNFAESLKTFASSFPSFDMAGYVQYGHLVRFVFLARTRVCAMPRPTVEEAESLCDRMSREHPGEIIVVMDFTAADYSHGLVLAQNQESHEYFGDTREKQHYIVPVRIGDVLRVSFAFSMAFHYPGRDFAVPQTMFNWASEGEGPVDAIYVLDPVSYMMVFRGTRTTAF